MSKIFYDTNALIKLQNDILKEKFYISSVTLQELEGIKTSSTKSEEVKYRARKVIHILKDNPDAYEVVIYNQEMSNTLLFKYDLEEIPDNKICVCALYLQKKLEDEIKFISNDLCCYVIAKNIFGLDVSTVNEKDETDYYKGYVEKILSEEEMAYFYSHLTENIYDLFINQYIIIRNEKQEIVDTLKWDGAIYVTVRCKPYKSTMFGQLKPLDEIQMCAMDSINTNDITVLYGRSGSGKTTLPLNYIIQELEKGRFKKCYFVYSFEPLKGAKTLGYEKGDHQTKLLFSSSIGNILASKFGDMDQVEFMINKGMIDIIPTANIRGVEFEKDSCVFVTEAQNIDVYTLKTIIQRCKTGCKQFYEGDIIEQKDTNIQMTGINRLIEVFAGNEKFGVVKLKNNYRSELCSLADKL